MIRSYVLPFTVLSLLAAACSAESALVGGECNRGYSAQDGRCVADAKPAPAPTTAPPTPPVSTTQPNEPAPPRPEVKDAGPDATLPSEPTGPTDPVVIVTPPPEPPAVVCQGDELACNDVCTAVKSDGQNCGACGRICPSNICIDGVCQGATPGDIVVIGHDMTQADDFTTHAKVFKNAVHLPTTDPLRVLAFEADATSELVAKTRALTGSGLGSRGLVFGQAAPEALENENLYAEWDVVLINSVSAANANDYGTRWAPALDSFTRKGGVLVALDNGAGDLPGFFSATTLMNLGAHQALASGTQFVVSAPGDRVGAQLLSPYAAFGSSVAFVGAPASTNDFAWVVRTHDSSVDAPTVIHKVAR